MLKNLNFIIHIFLISNICAQSVPDKFNYQIAIRDQSGKAISDRLCSFQISILDNPNASTFVYSEIHKNIQTRFGIASFQIGTGTPRANSTSISSIPFLSGSYYIKVEVDTDNGSAFSEISRTQLISVPYAVVAKESQTAKSLDPNSKIKLNQLDTSGAKSNAVIKFINNVWTIGTDNGGSASYTSGKGISILGNNVITNTGDGDSSSTNELQNLFLNGGVLSLSKSNQTVSLSLNGDVTGNLNNNSVIKLQGRPIASTAPTDGQYLKWVNQNNRWEPSNINSTGNSLWEVTNNVLQNTDVNTAYVNVIGNSDGELRVSSNMALNSRYPFIGYGSAHNATIGIRYNNSIGAGIRWGGTNYEVFGASKTFVVDHPEHETKVIVFSCIEGPESAAYERGTGQLINGRAEINYSENFNLIVNSNTVTINLTPISIDSKGLAIIEKKETGFIVGELNGGSGNYKFDWEVKGVRKGMEDFRVVRDKSEYEANNLNIKN